MWVVVSLLQLCVVRWLKQGEKRESFPLFAFFSIKMLKKEKLVNISVINISDFIYNFRIFAA